MSESSGRSPRAKFRITREDLLAQSEEAASEGSTQAQAESLRRPRGLGRRRFAIARPGSPVFMTLLVLVVAAWIGVYVVLPHKPKRYRGPWNYAERYAQAPAWPFKLAQGLSALMAVGLGLGNLVQAWTLAQASRGGSLTKREEGLIAIEGEPDCHDERLETQNGAPCLYLKESEQRWGRKGKSGEDWIDVTVSEFGLPFSVDGVPVEICPTEIYGQRSFADADRPATKRTLSEYLPLAPRVTVMGRLRFVHSGPRIERDPVFGMILSNLSLRTVLNQEFSKAIAGLSVAGFFLYFLLS